MSDIAILKEMIKEDITVSLEERREKTHSRYSVILTESQDNYSVTIDGMPKPDEVIIIQVDKFKATREIFNGLKGECKCADFILVADTATEKIVLCIEMKKEGDNRKKIVQQLYGAKCFITYCQEIGKAFWHQHKFLDDYQYRFISIVRIPIAKTKTRPVSKLQKTAITHDSPEQMLTIRGQNYLQFNHLL
jgi:hypothetical protein